MSDQSPGEGQPQFPPPQQYPGPSDAPTPPPAQPPAQPPAYPTSYPAPPEAPQGSPQNPYGAPQQYPAPPYGAPQYGSPPYGAPQYATGRDPDKRPGTVTAAIVITWISTVFALLGVVFLLILAAADNDEFFDELLSETDDFSRTDVRTGVIVVSLVLLFWGVSALVIAWFAFRRKNWARITLVVSAVLSIPLLGLTALAILPGFLLIGAIAAIILLFTGGANQWYRSAGQPPAPQQGQPTFY